MIATTRADGTAWTAPHFSGALRNAIARVARDFGVEDDWMNIVIGEQWKTGLPDQIQSDVEWLAFRALSVGVVGRRTLISLKLFAAVDQGPRSVHAQDLRTLNATRDELEEVRPWVESQDLSPEHSQLVSKLIRHVSEHR